jgi:hypothetical protein
MVMGRIGQTRHAKTPKKNTKMNDKALDKFVTTIGECQKIVSDLQKAVDNHLDKDPDKINWADVGDAQRPLSDLREIREYVK